MGWKMWEITSDLTRRGFTVCSLILVAVLFGFVEMRGAVTPASQPVDESVTMNGNAGGRIFDGVGAISSGSSLLLYDYPEPERSQILDYLFKPNYGASLQILKVEIGSDSNSSAAAEPSSMRTPTDVDCHRGIEWWLMKQAKARNPKIKLYGLMWGAPGWFDGGWWSPDHVRYLTTWLGCARENGLRIDYLGGGNERYHPPPQASFFIALHKALAATYPEVKIVATDEHIPPNYWRVAAQMKADPAYSRAVNILGEHDVCYWRSLYQHCRVSVDALNAGKPLWNSELSTQDAAAGWGPLARAITRGYIDARLTGDINFSAIASFYGNTAIGGTGLMIAETPWSGYYQVEKSIWVDAQTTQFVQPGWRYLDSASGYFINGASYVTLRSPNSGDYTVVIETMDAPTVETVKFIPAGGLSIGPVSIWSTDLASNDPKTWFVPEGTQNSGQQGIELTLQPRHIYTLSTTTGQHKGSARPAILRSALIGPNVQGWLPLPYRQDFEHIDLTHRAPYFQDVAGAFEAKPCGGKRAGTCYRQMISQQPLLWHDGAHVPGTLVGDPTWWGDYQVSADAMLEQPGYVELLGRVEQYNPDAISGYHFRVADTGRWQLYSEQAWRKTVSLNLKAKSNDVILASGSTLFGVGTWHRLSLRFEGNHIVAAIDDHPVASVIDDPHTTGQIGFMVSPWQHAEFDNLAVVKTRPWPRFVSQAGMVATATSSQPGVYQHHIYTPDQAIDGRIESRWSSQFNPPLALPQAITFDLGHSYRTYGLTYQPPGDTGRGGIITGYVVSVSTDGENFREAVHGTWVADTGTKIAAWPGGLPARFIRLQATAASGAGAGASEINVALTPLGGFESHDKDN